jgi:ABC-type proline/glycine betaine transport system ATPase subunit
VQRSSSSVLFALILTLSFALVVWWTIFQVIASHELSSIFAIGDRVIMLDGGGIVAEGDPRELRDRPTNDYVRAFFQHGKERAAA